MTSQHEGCPGSKGFHWHHTCWSCEREVCGYAQWDYYRCEPCQVEERKNYAKEHPHGDYDRTLALRVSCP